MPEVLGEMPVRVRQTDAEDRPVTTFDSTPLIFALVNAVRELAARDEALEAEPAP
jgi:hypothetical protein